MVDGCHDDGFDDDDTVTSSDLVPLIMIMLRLLITLWSRMAFGSSRHCAWVVGKSSQGCFFGAPSGASWG
eukprot:7039787-Pyramimonas_sp.AAC.1